MKTRKALFSSVLVILALLFIHGNAGAVTRYVPTPYTTIQSAIDAASSGDVVEVTNSSTYTECITMKDGVDLTSSTGQTPTINCTTDVTSTVTFTGAISDCDLDGFDIEHSSNQGAGINLDGTSGTVSTVIISNCNINNIIEGAGIRMSGTVTGCTIQSNEIYNIGVGGGGGGTTGAGIRMNGTINCSIMDNTFDNCDGAGISSGNPSNEEYVSDGSSITIKGNTIGVSTSGANRMKDAGIMLKGEPGEEKIVTVVIGEIGDNNIIKYNRDAGIRLERIDNLTVDSNTIFESDDSGMVIRDVGTSSEDAVVTNNTIYENGKGNKRSGINIGGVSYLTIGSNNTIRNNNQAGVTFNIGNVKRSSYTLAPSSKPVTITGNDIYENGTAGISIKEAISDTVTITENDIYLNDLGGIGIQHNCNLVIEKNTIRDSIRGGIHTGVQATDPGGFEGTNGSAVLTIKQNKVYDNGGSGYGGGVDVRHASGTIYNNLVYENYRGGIRFGDWITEIINNTVADNGNATDDMGGGIIYDNIYEGDALNADPAGNPPGALDIKNNICAYNQKAGIRACFAMTEDSEERDYNLLYANNGLTDCGWPSAPVGAINSMMCVNMQYGGCGSDWAHYPYLLSPHDKMAVPLFVNRDTDNYRIQSGSPAVDAGDTSYGTDVSIPPGVGTSVIDMGAYGGPLGINW